MKKRLIFKVALLLLAAIMSHANAIAVAFPTGIEEADSTNLALVATASTSFVSAWESLAAVNDGFTPAHSNDKSHTAYGNWYNPNSYQWVQYNWDRAFILTSVEIYWFDDGGGVLTPNEAFIECYNESTKKWDRITDVPCVKDKFNFRSLGEIETSGIRVTMKNNRESTGILEFRVWGRSPSGSTDLERPSIPGIPTIKGMDQNSLTIEWEPSTDNEKVSIYNVFVDDSLVNEAPYHIAQLKGLAWNSHFMVSVQAVDVAGNLSGKSEAVWIFYGDAEEAKKAYDWPSYSPTLDYNFKDEFPGLEMPTKDLDDCPQVVGTQSSGWWTFKWGPNKRSVVTEAAITPMLERLNQDFAYFRDTMGWPPDRRAKEGYRSAVYLFGSGLSCIDNADSTALGGWQSGINGYPCILASYYPIYSFDPSCPYADRGAQMGAMVHEGIHAVLADLPGIKKAAWFHEGGNTWLQQEMESRKSGDYSSMGFLNAPAYLAPFMPIECYTGWLQDGSFGGPSAEGVNMFEGSQQICTWRRLLGGNQYGNTFPTFLGQVLGKGSVPWIWRNCPERVLEGMADGIGDMQIRRLIMEYRAKQALIDMGEWNVAIKKLLDGNINSTIGAEWTPNWINCTPWKASPYVKTWMVDTENKILRPEPRTTPGWSGANQIPLKVSGSEVAVNFIPKGENLTLQLCYRATDGTPVYSYPVSSGECRLKLDKAPANGVVIAVICNTNYIYEGEDTRFAHYDYRVQLVEGVVKKASVYRRWYDWAANITDVTDPVEPFPTEGPIWGSTVTDVGDIRFEKRENNLKLYPNPLSSNDVLKLEFADNTIGKHDVRIIDARGSILFQMKDVSGAGMEIPIEGHLRQGIYFVNIQNSEKQETQKFVIQ